MIYHISQNDRLSKLYKEGIYILLIRTGTTDSKDQPIR
jgi:hypothetical protein